MRRNVVLAASAGTGKTFHLVGAMLHLLLGASELQDGAVDPARIVATTFSRKAAGEIRERLIAELERLGADAAGSPYVESLRARIGKTGEAGDKALGKLARKALASVDRAEVTTLHGLAHRIARAHTLELGVDSDVALASEEVTARITHDAVTQAASAFADRHPDEMLALLRLFKGSERLVDGVMQALAKLEELGIAAAEVALASDDETRIESELVAFVELARTLSGEPTVAAAARALGRAWDARDAESLEAALVELFAVRRSAKASEALLGLCDARDALPKAPHRAQAERLVRRWASRASASRYPRAFRELLIAAEANVSAAFASAKAVSFGGILRAARDVLRDHPRVAADFAAETDALLVDEFQDTSRIQYELLMLLWERDPAARAPGKMPSTRDLRGKGLFVVGDRKQSIYAFRGADVGVFTSLAIALAGEPARRALQVRSAAVPLHPTADFFPLRDNWRSEPELLAFTNAFSRLRLAAATDAPDEVTFSDEVDALRAPAAKAKGDGTPRATWIRGPKPGERTTHVEDAEAATRTILGLARGDASLKWRDFAVIAFSNDMLDAMAYALARAHVPYVAVGRGFHHAPEVRDMRAMLGVLARPGDRLALLEVLRGPWAAASDPTLVGLTEPHRGVSLDLARWGGSERRALIAPEDWPAIQRLRSVVLRLRESLHRLGPGGALRAAVEMLGLEETLLLLPRGEQRVANVRKLLAMADEERDAQALLARLDWAANATGEAEAAIFSDDDDAVRLLTAHASKGLDFPVVIIPEVSSDGARRGNLPLLLTPRGEDAAPTLAMKFEDARGDSWDTPSFADARREEERRNAAERHRLLYVAVTRAAKQMFFVGEGTAQGSLASTLRALVDLGTEALAVEDFSGDSPPFEPVPRASRAIALEPSPERPLPRRLPVATTALADFAGCARRFELLHVRGLVEGFEAAPSDAREEGSLVHRVLELVALDAFGAKGAGDAARAVALRVAHWLEPPMLERVVAKATRFLESAYAARIREEGARVDRERAFVIELAGEPNVLLHGTMDVLVHWPGGGVDVLDYKSTSTEGAKRKDSAHSLQLDAYAVAASEMMPLARVRAGVVPLGDARAEPRFRAAVDPNGVRAKLAALGAELARRRRDDAFSRVALARCKELSCGFTGLCHARAAEPQLSLF